MRVTNNRSDKETVVEFEALICVLTDQGLNPQFQSLSNEASRTLKIFFTSQEIDFQLAPPRMHATMPPSVPSRPSRTILLLVCALWIHYFP
jgi:hypothetical protein